jgi:putative membrane protein
MGTSGDLMTSLTPSPQGAPAGRPFFGQPFMWLLFAVALLLVPAAGYLLQAGLPWDETHPALNAMLNGLSGVFLVAGYIGIRRGAVGFHLRCMLAAVASSTLFLISYLARMAMSGSHRYPGDGIDRVIYLAVLFSHMILAAVILPLVLRTLYLAWRRRFDAHRAVARWTWPIWIYVSITGVIVYVMLYPLAHALYGR